MSHLRLRLCVAIGALIALVGSANALAAGDLVVSQVYGGGGNAGASYTHDYIEIFNRGNVSVPLNGMSVQYASATGTGNFGASTTQITELPNVALLPGQYFLIQEASTAAVGAPLPTADVVDATPIAMSGTAGKVALVVDAVDARLQRQLDVPCSPAAAGADRRSRRLRQRQLLRGRRRGTDLDEHVVGGVATLRAAPTPTATAPTSSRSTPPGPRNTVEPARPVRRPSAADQSERHGRANPGSVLPGARVDSHRHRHAGREPDRARESRSRAT